MKNNLFLLLVLTSFASFSQNFAGMFSNDLKNKEILAFHSLNKKNNESTLYFVNNDRIIANRLSSSMQFKDSISTNKPSQSNKNILGNINTENESLLFFGDDSFKSIFCLSFDFQKRNVDFKIFNFITSEDKILQYFSENEKFYVLSTNKSSNKVKLTIINENKELNELYLESSLDQNSNDLLMNVSVNNENINMNALKININSYCFYTESSKMNKAYFYNNQFILSFDSNNLYTKVIVFDLIKNSITEKNITKTSQIPYNDIDLKSNSFLQEGKLFQIAFNKSDLVVTIKDLDNNLIKEFSSFTSDFDNVEFIKEHEIDAPNITKKRDVFLKSMANGEAGISCYKDNNNFLISFGRAVALVLPEEKRENSYATIGGAGGFVGALIGAIIDNSSNSNKNVRSFLNNGRYYFNYSIDTNFNYVQTASNKKIGAEKLRSYLKLSDNENGSILFKIDTITYYGFYDHSEKRYFIRKFDDY
ncbi:hypothetical protein QLS31_08105 [Flavobacterium sp. XS2P24]|uniref:hypothetical protein n=1 Tax=Flavobacterium sp. XS2P24 TaxID=3041249 RepID=UPI0024A94E63|nr:hypothetical protein [Flavobacterium sp. XS2P24]MDI6049791.1 hypothetical protein [Flavobacterium sp. XS2P24]